MAMEARRSSQRRSGRIAATLALALVGACQPTVGPDSESSSPVAAIQPSAVSGSPQVSLSGSVVHIAGTGAATTPDFDLPAGDAGVAVSTCTSNQVIPFVTLFDANQAMLGLIVDAKYEVKSLKGGKYHLSVVANPDCAWTVDLTPK
jgi:hypothetical protein